MNFFFLFLHCFFDVFDNFRAILCTENNADTLDDFYLFRCDLRITAADSENRMRIFPVCTADNLAAFAVAETRHRAGIDDISIRLLTKRNDFMPFLLKETFHRFGLELIDLAAKRHKSNLQSYLRVLPFKICFAF